MRFVYGMWYKVEDKKECKPFWMLMTRELAYTMPRGGGKITRIAHQHLKDLRNLGFLCGSDKVTAGDLLREFHKAEPVAQL